MQIGAGAGRDQGGIVAWLQPETHRQHHQGVLLQTAVAVGKVEFPSGELEGAVGLGRIHHPHRVQPLGGAAPLGTGIHHRGTTGGAGDADRPLQAGQPSPGCLAGQAGQRFACRRLHPALARVQPAALQAPQAEGEPLQPPIGNQQV